MYNTDPSKPEGCYPTLFQSMIAAALSHEVEVVLTGTSSGLGRKTAQALLRTGEYHVIGAVRE